MAAPRPIDATSPPTPSQATSQSALTRRTHFHRRDPLLHAHAKSPIGPPATPRIEIYQTNPFIPPATPRPVLFSARYAAFLPSARSHHKPVFCYPKFPGGIPMRTISLCLIAAAAHAATTPAAPRSPRVEPGGPSPDALVRSAPVPLTIGKRYELSAWVRTDNLTVRDTGRSPIAIGAALSMASMPFDVHSESRSEE